MQALRAVLLILLLSGQPGSSWAQEDGDEDLEPESYSYDDDDEEEEEETNMIPGSRDRVLLQCYFCQVLHSGDSCNQTQRCAGSRPFCITVISHSETSDKGYLTTYSMWCTDTCQALVKTVESTQVTQTCCQSSLCNIPPWQSPQIQNPLGGRADSPLESGTRHPQDGRLNYPQVVKVAHPRSNGGNLPKGGKPNQPQGSGAGCPPGWTEFGNTVLLLSFLTSLWASWA